MLKTVIVEDDRMVAAINAQFAEKTPGVQVVATFHNGRDALAFLEQTIVDLLLLDLYMPEMSGVELLTELRRKGCNADAIFITAANDAPHIQDALRLGAVDYLIKPFRYERFEEALDKVVVRRKVIESGLEFTQADIDEMIRARRPNPESRTGKEHPAADAGPHPGRPAQKCRHLPDRRADCGRYRPFQGDGAAVSELPHRHE